MEGLFPKVDYAVQRQTCAGWEIPERVIENHEIVLVNKAGGWVEIEGRRREVKEDDLFYFPPGVPHALGALGDTHMAFTGIHFSFEAGALSLPLHSRPGNVQRVRALCKSLLLAWKEKDAFFAWRQSLLMSEILLVLHEGSLQSPAANKRINHVLQQIHARPFDAYSLESLCGLAGMKKSAFTEAFRQAAGKPPARYILELRLQHAAGMLLTGNEKIREVALACGFADEFYFSRAFKQVYGLPPREYRKRESAHL